MLINRRLNTDLSPLWTSDYRFILRFRDMSEEKQTNLGKRIKETAPYATIRRQRGPTVEQIHECLLEFNPVIFAEDARSNHRHSYSSFATYKAFTMTSYCYKKVCESIYKLLCLKRPLRRAEIERIVSTTTINWNITSAFMENHFPLNESLITPEERQSAREMGLEEIHQLTRRIEDSGITNVPREMREEDAREIPEPDVPYMSTPVRNNSDQILVSATPRGYSGTRIESRSIGRDGRIIESFALQDSGYGEINGITPQQIDQTINALVDANDNQTNNFIDQLLSNN